MLMQAYAAEELKFAWCNRVYLRFQTHRRKSIPSLACATTNTLNAELEAYAIHLLEVSSGETELRLLASLRPDESISTAASKIKGRLSKWLNSHSSVPGESFHFAKGYFAVTTGASTTTDVHHYLESQSLHHGYENRARPPVFIGTFPRDDGSERRLATDHAVTSLRYHLVFATEYRHGVFHRQSGQELAEHWRSHQDLNRCIVDKVSIVPDHIHMAVGVHPAVKISELAVTLMNAAQEMMWTRFEADVIRASIRRLWQPSAYLGSYGDLSSAAISKYVKRWEV